MPTNPGYGPSGFNQPISGLQSWTGASPPVTKRPELPPELPATALGLGGGIPRKLSAGNDVPTIKES